MAVFYMTEEEVLLAISRGETAEELLNRADPNFARRFTRLTKALGTLINDVREYFPDAEYYTSAGDSPVLLLGKSHSEKQSHNNSQQELIAVDCHHSCKIGGGDW